MLFAPLRLVRFAVRTAVRALVVAIIVSVAATELASWRAGRRSGVAAVRAPAPGARCAVVVLGYPARGDGRPHPVQRWRVAIAMRTQQRTSATRMVFCGGAVRGPHVEAESMAALARDLGLAPELVVIEGSSQSTRENVALARPLVEGYDTVLLASDPVHAARARALWVEQFPEDVARVALGDTYRPLERPWLKVPGAVYEAWLWAGPRVRRRLRGAPPIDSKIL